VLPPEPGVPVSVDGAQLATIRPRGSTK